MTTSDSAPSPATSRFHGWFVYGVWAAMTLQAAAFVARYADAGPIVDEWEFIPALTDEEPFWPWLWKLHNEHRFPLGRLIYYPLFKLTGDFRTGCWVSVVGVSLLSLLMISTARRLRGHLHFADAFFPMSLLHAGHWENFQMGYQIVFMLNLVLAAVLLRVILLTDRGNISRRGVQAGVLSVLLLGCGAGGLVFGPFMAIWILALAFWFRSSPSSSSGLVSRAGIVLLATAVPGYIALYLQGYHRPSHHQDPLEVWGNYPTALWQALRSSLQALSMAVGPGATGPWPASAFLIVAIGWESAMVLVRLLMQRIEERPRALGLLLFLASVAFMAFGIGWGRCVFLVKGEPGDMGFSSRYCWIVWPALGCIYFMCILYREPFWSILPRKLLPGCLMILFAVVMPIQAARRYSRDWTAWLIRHRDAVVFFVVAGMLPFNIATGIIEGEKHKEKSEEWERAVRAGMPDDELIEQYFPAYTGELKERLEVGLKLLRKHRVLYFVPLPKKPLASFPLTTTLSPGLESRREAKNQSQADEDVCPTSKHQTARAIVYVAEFARIRDWLNGRPEFLRSRQRCDSIA